jgi:pimeloyl-ACP methyl ester carboxylesterase
MAKQLSLPDGRTLDYAITGASNGFPLIWHHGTPSGKLSIGGRILLSETFANPFVYRFVGYIAIPSLAAACEKKGVTLVTFSRSGYGGSSRRKGRSIVDDVDDVRALLKHLGYSKCVVGG